jgi:Putative cyclase
MGRRVRRWWKKYDMRYIDLSHTIEDGMVTYKGLPAPIICDYLSREASQGVYADGTEFQIGKIEMVTNTGTYIDCPFHRPARAYHTAGGRDTDCRTPLQPRRPARFGLHVQCHATQI